MATQYQAERLASNLRKVRDKAEEMKRLLSGAEKYAEEMMNKDQQGMYHSIDLLAGEIKEMAHRLQKACAAGLSPKRMAALDTRAAQDGVIQPEVPSGN